MRRRGPRPRAGERRRRWLAHRRVLLSVPIVVGCIPSLWGLGHVVSAIERDAAWAGPGVAASETLAWGGIAVMLVTAGARIGNPVTAKARLKAVMHEVKLDRRFRFGWIVNVVGAAGTSGIVVAVAVVSLPARAWPLATVGVACSLAASGLPFYRAVFRPSPCRNHSAVTEHR